jgi:hemolysin activation/secretion protein
MQLALRAASFLMLAIALRKKFFMKKKLVATFFLLFLSFEARAQVTPEQQQSIGNIQNQIIQRQNQIEQEEVKQRDNEQVVKDREGLERHEIDEYEELELEAGKIVQNYRRIQCFHIDEVIFSKNNLIEQSREISFTKPYLNRCLNLEQISDLAQEITDYLVAQGYVTSKAEIPKQSLYSKTLRVDVLESHLEKILFNEEKFFDKTQKFTAFGFYEKEKILNIHPLEIGLDQVNRLSSNKASIKFLDGKDKNHAIALIENNSKNRSRINLSFDNHGNNRTGDKRETIGFAQDNLFWLNDNFTISRTANDLDSSRKNRGGNQSLSANFSLPFYLYNLNFSYAKSSNFFFTNSIKSNSNSVNRGINIDRLLVKNKKTKISGGLAFNNRENNNFIDDVRVESTSRKASIISAHFSQTFFLHNATIFYKPSYSKGLGILGGSNKTINSRHSDFDIFRFYGNYTQKFLLKEHQFSYNLALDSQIARQHLYSIDQFSVGGVYSVRGFKNGTISGDSGFNLRNEISFNLGQFAKDSKLPLQYFALTPFYDYGYVENVNDSKGGRLSGAGLKAIFTYKDLRASLTFSRAISKSHLLKNQNYHDDTAVFFNIGSNLSF